MTILAIEIFGESALNHDILSTEEEITRFKRSLEEATAEILKENARKRMQSLAAADNRWVL